MTSHFSTGTTRRKTPSWCKPGMFPKAQSVTDGRPDRILCWLRWYDSPGSDLQIDWNTLIEVRRNATNNGYHAEYSTPDQSFSIDLIDNPDLDHYDLQITVMINGHPYQTEAWVAQNCREVAPWGINERRRTWNEGDSFLKFIAKA